MYCSYYQAETVRDTTWFVTGSIRSQENMCFFRTLDAKKNLMEFFVPPEFEDEFVAHMTYLKENGHVVWWEKMENRLITQDVE